MRISIYPSIVYLSALSCLAGCGYRAPIQKPAYCLEEGKHASAVPYVLKDMPEKDVDLEEAIGLTEEYRKK